MSTYRLYKKEKLCSAVALEQLFAGRGADCKSALAWPLRAVWRSNPGRRSDAPVQFVISVPKKRLHTAVERVQMRRRIREAYRLNRDAQLEALPAGSRLDLAFVYVANTVEPYAKVQRAMLRLLQAVAKSADETHD